LAKVISPEGKNGCKAVDELKLAERSFVALDWNDGAPPQLLLAQRLHDDLMQPVQLYPDQHGRELLMQRKDVVDDLIGLPLLDSGRPSVARSMTNKPIRYAGTNGRQRGTSRREDALDTVIALRRPEDYSPEHGARFEIHFEKLRNRVEGDGSIPFEARV